MLAVVLAVSDVEIKPILAAPRVRLRTEVIRAAVVLTAEMDSEFLKDAGIVFLRLYFSRIVG
jgi:hypothetical protein